MIQQEGTLWVRYMPSNSILLLSLPGNNASGNELLLPCYLLDDDAWHLLGVAPLAEDVGERVALALLSIPGAPHC